MRNVNIRTSNFYSKTDLGGLCLTAIHRIQKYMIKITDYVKIRVKRIIRIRHERFTIKKIYDNVIYE